ncbi:MAG: hypothetical protein ABDH37_00175 [Candidatus Hydrothermales bacterium]
MKNFFEKIAKIDRRIVYLLIFLGVTIPLITKKGFKFEPLQEVKKAYDFIESLPEGSVILISIDYDAASMPELQPLLEVVLRHLFSNNLKVLMMGHWPLGLPLGQIALEKIAKEMNKKYGYDYVFLGYRPGVAAVILNMGKEIRTVFNTDYKGTPIDSLEMMRGIHNYSDIALLIGFEAGATGDFWVQFGQARFGLKIILTSTAVITPDLYPYYQAGQIVGLIGGLRGAADYEILVKRKGFAYSGMTAQTIIHIIIIILILLGNIGYFALRRLK